MFILALLGICPSPAEAGLEVCKVIGAGIVLPAPKIRFDHSLDIGTGAGIEISTSG